MRAKMNSCYSSIIHFDAPSSFLLPSTLCVSTVAVTVDVGSHWDGLPTFLAGSSLVGRTLKWQTLKLQLEDKSLLKEIQTFVLIIVQRALTLQFKVSDCVGIKFEDISKRSHQFRVQWDKPAAKWASAHPYWSSQGSNQFSLLSCHYLWKPQTVYNKSAKCSKKSVQTRVSNFCLNSKAFLDVEDGQEERFRLSHLHNAVD